MIETTKETYGEARNDLQNRKDDEDSEGIFIGSPMTTDQSKSLGLATPQPAEGQVQEDSPLKSASGMVSDDEVKAEKLERTGDPEVYNTLPNKEISPELPIGLLVIRLILSIWALYIGSFYKEWPVVQSGVMAILAIAAYTFGRSISFKNMSLFLDAVVLVSNALFGIVTLSSSMIRSMYFSAVALMVLQRLLAFGYGFFKKGSRTRIIGAVGVYALAMLILLSTIITTLERHILYPGMFIKKPIPKVLPSNLQLSPEYFTLNTSDGLALKAWLLKPTPNREAQLARMNPVPPRLTLWFLYGNGNTYVDYLDYLIPMFEASYPNLQIFVQAYRGFLGGDGGWPSESGLLRDLDAGVEFLLGRSDVDKNGLVAFGHSLGSALLINVMNRHLKLLKGAIISNAFLSIPRVLSDHYFGFLNPLISDEWDNEDVLKKIPSLPPILMMSSRKDKLIPPHQMDALRRIMEAKREVTFIEFPYGTHNNWSDKPRAIREMSLFLHKIASRLA